MSAKKYLYILNTILVLVILIIVFSIFFSKNKINQAVQTPFSQVSQNNSQPSAEPNLTENNNSIPTASPPPTENNPASNNTYSNSQIKHVLIILGENQNFSDVIGNTKDMPYLNSLAKTYAYAKEYYGNVHPSMGNYFMLTGGQIFSDRDSFSDEVKDDNIVRHLIAAGKTWKEYSENLPEVGYTGKDKNGYTQHHNPLSYYSDVRENSAQSKNLVSFSQFSIDLANHQLPNFSFIVPNNEDNAHSCPISGCSNNNKLTAFDNWLKTNIDPLIKNSDFNTPGNDLLIITFDEASSSDSTRGGGHTVWVVAGPDVKKGYTSSVVYQQENTLRFISEELGLTSFPGKAATAASMKEFLVGS